MAAAKFGFRTQTFYKWGLGKTLKALAEMGFAGVDITFEHPDTNPIRLSDPKEARRVARMVADSGLDLMAVSYHIGCDVPTISHTMDIALEMGANLVIINGDPTPSAGLDSEWQRTVERVKRLCELAEGVGITLAMEPDFVPGFTVASSADFERLVKEVNSPALKLNMDINHAVKTDDDYLGWMRRLADYLVHVHLSDSRNRKHQHLIPGEGVLDWKEMKATLDAIGYDGYYVVDIWDDFDTPDVTARQSLAALKRMWEL
ncbi:MAG: sugar phosphate isomerase/epimerase family protein [Anaerolineae bacterium]